MKQLNAIVDKIAQRYGIDTELAKMMLIDSTVNVIDGSRLTYEQLRDMLGVKSRRGKEWTSTEKILLDDDILQDIVDFLAEDENAGKSIVDKDSLASLAAPLNGYFTGKSPLIPGLFLFFGSARSGKSRGLAEVGDMLNCPIWYFAEPDHRTMGTSNDAVRYMTTPIEDGTNAVLPSLILIDSIKDILYQGSSLTSGGVSMTAINKLSLVSAQLMRSQRTVIANINSGQPERAQAIYEALASSVTGVADLDNAIMTWRQWNGEYYERNVVNHVNEPTSVVRNWLRHEGPRPVDSASGSVVLTSAATVREVEASATPTTNAAYLQSLLAID